MPASAEISLIFQGPVVGSPKDPPASQVTRLCLESARRALPQAEIILSTWAGADVTGLVADKILLNADPGNWKRDDGVACNVNRQIVSTREGLRAASRPFAAKIRSDTALTTGAFADFPRAAAPRSPRWAIFAERILTIERFARDPARLPLLHHIGDLFHFGLREDLLLLWDVPFNLPEHYQNWEKHRPRPWLLSLPDQRIYIRQSDEQHVWIQCVRKKFPDVDLDYLGQMPFSAISLSEALLTANFVIVTNEQAGIKLPDRFIANGWPSTCYQSRDWPRLTELYQRDGHAFSQFARAANVYCSSWCVRAQFTWNESAAPRLTSMWQRLKNRLRPYWHRLRDLRHRPRRPKGPAYVSETSKCRARLAPFCQGAGLDIGPGGDPIVPAAIRVDLPTPYSSVGSLPVQLPGDATNLLWFKDGTLDYVYSSHVLEDFVDTTALLREWLRVLKPGGFLVIYCPDERRFRAHCAATGQPYNPAHKLAHFSLDWVKQSLAQLGETDFVHELPNAEIYSWDLVVRRSAHIQA